jgi:murein DD-endopeptidase MepM/ murein hydrolase activator NlpD
MRRIAAAAMMAATLGACIPSVDRDDSGYPAPLSARDYASEQRDDAPRDRETLDRRDPLDEPGGEEVDRPVRRIDLDPPTPARPAWEARPVAADARAIPDGSVVVAPGDLLRRIAEASGAGVEAIARANGLAPPYAIQAGQRLTIPGGRYHLVRPGESGIAIARAYGVEWSRIVAANDLAEPYVLRAGQRILVPGAAAGTSNRAAERAAAFRLDIDDILTGGEPALAVNQAPARPTSKPTRALPPSAVVAPPQRLAGGGFVWPVDGRVVKRFGRGASGERNDGIKIGVPVSTPIHATADGVVAYAGDGIAALGGLVIVKHGGGWTSVYGHASKLLVSRGQSVKRGQTIALSGDTGFADRPEVHFELRRGRTPVDPTTQLPRT